MSDPIADMLTRIRNALAVKKPEIVLPFSRIKLEILKILKREKYIENFQEEIEDKKELKIFLKYDEKGRSVIRSLKRISKPGRRIYLSKEIPRVLAGKGIAIISTSQGFLTDKEARKRKIGGEVICELY